MRTSLKTIVLLICALIFVVNTSNGQEAGKRALENDIRDLYGGNALVQSQAIRRLVNAGSRAIPLLVHVICDTKRSGFEDAWPSAAKALGELKAEAAAPCLLHLLITNVPPGVGSVIMKSDATLEEVDPAFAALAQIGAPGVPAIRHLLPLLYPDQAIVAIRVLKSINTPDAREAAEAYVRFLEQQLKVANQEIEGFASKPVH